MDVTTVLDLFMVAMGVLAGAFAMRALRESLDTRASDPSTEPVRRGPATPPAPERRPGGVVLTLVPPPAPPAAVGPTAAAPGPVVVRRVFGPFAYGPDGRARRPLG